MSSPTPSGSRWQPPTPEELQALLPKYEITRLVGHGGMGAVYHGSQPMLERAVAVKILPPSLEASDPTYGQRFRQEAMALAKLNHPGIVLVFDFGATADGLLYIVMEYVDGTDVAQMLAQQKRLAAKDAVAITAHVCDALAYAHARGIIHRDIKPANILVGYNGAVKVADFGLAKARQDGASLTQSGHAMGSPHYISPEALAVSATVDSRADIYSLGVMLHHMLTGEIPRGIFDPASQKVQDLDSRYDAIIARAMQNDPAERFPDVQAMRRALDAILTQPVVKVDPASVQAPAALNTAARPQRHASAPQPIRRMMPVRPPPPPQTDWGFWLPVLGAMAALVAFVAWMKWPVTERKTARHLEAEALPIIETTGGKAEVRKDVAGFKQAVWSGGGHLWWGNGKKGDRLRLRLPVEEAGRQRLRLLFTVAEDGGIVDAKLDGRALPGSPFNLHASDLTLNGMLDAGVWDLMAGDHELEFTLAGTHGKAFSFGDSCVGLDCLRLEPPVMAVPVVAAGTDLAPLARASASYCFGNDNVRQMSRGNYQPGHRSNDMTKPRFTWHPQKHAQQWAQYEWNEPRLIAESRVFWYDDRFEPRGECALPVSWRLLYREDETGAWLPVQAVFPTARRSEWSTLTFPPVRTTALRITAQCEQGFSAGICHWKVLAADATAVAEASSPRAPLFLGDSSPADAQLGWGRYRINHYDHGDARGGRGVFVDGKPCSQFLWAHPTSRIEYAIPSGYTRFTASGVGPADLKTGIPVSSYGSWTFQVLVDGKSVFQSPALNSIASRKASVDVLIPSGARRLTLITDPMGNGNSDHAFWADPTLHTDSTSKTADLPRAASLDAPTALPSNVMLQLASTPLVVDADGNIKATTGTGTRFNIVPAVTPAPGWISLQQADAAGRFIRHQNAKAYAHSRPSAADRVFEFDATWRLIRLDGDKVRFESFNYPGTFLAVRDDGTVIQQRNAPAAAATFLLK